MHPQLEVIKNIYRDNVSKGKLLSLDALKVVLEDYEYSSQDWLEVKSWYENINDFSYLKFESIFEEIIIHHPQNICYCGPQSATEKGPLSSQDFELSLLLLTIKYQVEWNYRVPFCSFLACFKDKKYRVTLVHHSTLPNQTSKAFIRSIAPSIYPMDSFISKDKCQLLAQFIKSQKNVLLCGPTGSGKTSLLNSMASNISQKEHIIVIEDTMEIQLQHPFTSRMLALPQKHKSMEDYLAYAMRMSPNRIILGEIRSQEVVPYLLALNTGHRGCLATIHANSAIDSLHRLALLYCVYGKGQLDYQLILKLVCSNIDTVIFMQDKKVIDICQIYGSENGQVMFESFMEHV